MLYAGSHPSAQQLPAACPKDGPTNTDREAARHMGQCSTFSPHNGRADLIIVSTHPTHKASWPQPTRCVLAA
eukprot:m.175451 g.175451  ORF g.175451 m.175451 type:complete len:72 (-) comp24407_c2_seq1:283-498(-)